MGKSKEGSGRRIAPVSKLIVPCWKKSKLATYPDKKSREKLRRGDKLGAIVTSSSKL